MKCLKWISFALIFCMGFLYSQTLNKTELVYHDGTYGWDYGHVIKLDINGVTSEYRFEILVGLAKTNWDTTEYTHTYRPFFRYDLSGIDENATITGVKLNIDNGYELNKVIGLNRMSGIYIGEAERTWNAIDSGAVLDTSINLCDTSFYSIAAKNAIIAALDSNDSEFFIGVYSDSSIFDMDVNMEVEYTVPAKLLSLTAQNDVNGLNGGNIGVAIYPAIPDTHASPYSFTAYEEDTLNFAAFDHQTIDDKTCYFNDGELQTVNSEWKQEKNVSFACLSSSQTFTSSKLSVSDDSSKFIAYLKVGYTLSGSMLSNETWTDLSDVTLMDDLTIPSNVTLTIDSSANIDLNGYDIISSGGSILINNEADIEPYVTRTNSSSAVLGIYSTVSSAASNLITGQDINVYSNDTLVSNVSLPSSSTLNVCDGGELNLDSYTITGDVEVESLGKLNPYVCVESSSADKYFPNTSSAVSYISDPSDKLILNGELTLSNDVTITEHLLEIGSRSDINLNGKKIFIDLANMGSISSLSSSATFSPDIRSYLSSNLTGFHGVLSSAFTSGSYVELKDTLVTTVDLTVPSSKTLKILDNAVVKMAVGKYLDVYGTLNAKEVYFTASSTTTGGIEFQTSSAGTIDACCFDNCALAINVNNASPTLKDNVISDSGYGIRIYGSSNPSIHDNYIWDCNYGMYIRSCDANIYDNYISDCSVYGLYLYNTSPDVESNEIENSRVYLNSCYSTFEDNYIYGSTGSSYTMYMYNSDPCFFYNTIIAEDNYTIQTNNSCPEFGLMWEGAPESYGYNVLNNDENNDGVLNATNGSEVTLGYGDSGCYSCGGNTILNANYPLWADATSIVYAHYCYWDGDDAPDCDAGAGYVETYDEIYNDPDGGSSLAKMYSTSYSTNGNISVKDLTPEDSLYKCANQSVMKKDYADALLILEQIITNYQSSTTAYKALNLSIKLCNKSELANSEGWLVKMAAVIENDDLGNIVGLKMASNYQKNGKINDAIAISETMSNKSNNKHEVSTLFNLFNLYHKDKCDIKNAEKYFNKLKQKYPDNELTLIACSDMDEEYYDETLSKTIISEEVILEEEIELPVEFAFHPAYPNPFNPLTTLEFDLPISAKVECCVFDLRGNLVKEYKYNKQSGTHRMLWNGSNVPSGIYLIRFTAEAEDGTESFVDYQKVTLLK